MIDLPEYRLTALLYEGEVDALYSGFRAADGAPVAVKLLGGEYPDPEDIARLRHEYAILKELALPGVVRAYALLRIDKSPALVLEHLRGRPLSALLKDGPLDLGAALRIAASIADTLEAIHRMHVVHRDIKPANIIVDLDAQRVTLIDFGIAVRVQEASEDPSDSGLPPPGPEGSAAGEGTLAYMSPEQTGRMNRAVDARADLYSLGVTLYEMLIGALPFEETDPVELVHSHIARTPPRPSDRAPGIPAIVSDVVMKLLAKAAEDRYQSARGLKADLDECLARRSSAGAIEPFPLGLRDLERELRIPRKLYGREEELAALTAAFERASQGAAELVLVKGYAGVGKSALVSEIHGAIARRGGYYGAGKADQFGHGIPYAPVSAALREILRRLLTERLEVLAAYRSRFEAALGASGRILFELIPELALCLGPQPEVPALGPAEARIRFHVVFQSFIRACTAEATLVIFLDDLQWADPASLSLLQLLLTDPGSARLLVIGAYRDNEVSASHPLSRALGALHAAGAATTDVALGPLSLESVTALLADTLRRGAREVAPAAEILFAKTHGNPFFLGRLLHALHRDGAIFRDGAAAAWSFDLDRVAGAASTENVVEFMAAKIRELSPEAARALSLAACVGYRFDPRALAIIAEEEPAAVVADLAPAIEEGLILPLGSDDVAYRFLHDRVQQAAYSLIEEADRQEVHLRIGRLLSAGIEGDPGDELLLDVVNHKNAGVGLIASAAERAELARWNLLAGRRAKASSACEAAVDYLAAGIALLDASAWASDHALAYALHAERAECEYLAGRMDEAEVLFADLLLHAATDIERASVESERIAVYLTTGQFSAALRAGREGLKLFGLELPETEPEMKAAVGAELAEVTKNLGGRPIEALLDAPEIEDPTERVILRLLTEMWTPAHFGMPALRNVITLKHVNFSLRHGHSDVSAFGYVVHCTVLARVLGRYEDARDFGRLALALHARLPNAYLTCRINMLFGSSAHFFEPLRTVLPYLDRAYDAGLTYGDLSYASFSAAIRVLLSLNLGTELDALEREIDIFLEVVRHRTRDELALVCLTYALQVLRNLTGRTQGRHTLDDGDFVEAELMKSLGRPGFEYAACWYFVLRQELAVIHGDHAAAIAMTREAEATLASAQGTYLATELDFFAFLAYAGARGGAAPEDAARIDAELARHEARVASFAAHCPANYRGKHLLLLAERARLEARELDAMGLYDQAIDAAREEGFLRDEALACELAAGLHRDKGRERIARAYLADARHAYLRWGAAAKVADLDERSPTLVRRSEPAPRSATRSSIPALSSTARRTDGLDAMAVVRAAQAIAGELLLSQVVERLLRITLSNAGAQRGALLLEQDGELQVTATITLQPDLVRLGPPRPLADAAEELSASVVQYVERTREAVVLGDAARDARWSGDPYVRRERPRSILCLSMVHHGRLTGVLYLENNAAADAFTPARIEVCRLLSSQAAIAVENALLYARVKAAGEEQKKANEALEEEVARRTEELRAELAERARAEAAREALQAEIIRAQAERMQEMSTPLIPILAGVMVMPLVGAIDADRAQKVLEAALHGASASRARVVIVDITGVKQVGAEVAATLARTAGALALLGAEVVVTGIRPEVAQTLVTLGIGVGSMVTRGTLESGVVYALERVGARVVYPGRG